MYLSNEQVTALDLSSGFLEFIDEIASRAKQWGDNFATAFQKTKIAEDVGKDSRTITRYVQELETKGLGSVETKRGKNGGTVVVFNKDMLDFEPTDNPMTSETKKADEIRDYLFPRSVKNQPLRRYRTKEEITEATMLSRARKDADWERNEQLSNMPHVTRSFFDSFAEPELYYKAYLVSRMYNAYAVIFPREKMLEHAEDVRLFNLNKKAVERAQKYDVLPPRFSGTHQYEAFVKLQRLLDEHDINPLGYLTVQFDYSSWLAEHKKTRPNGLPFINTLYSEVAMERYKNSVKYFRTVRNRYNDRKMSQEKVIYIGAKYPIIQALNFTYQGVSLGGNLDYMLDEMTSNAVRLSPIDYTSYGLELEEADIKYNNFVNRVSKLTAYYHTASKDIADSTISEQDKLVLTSYLKEQVALYSHKNSLSAVQFTMAFPTQIIQAKRTVEASGADISNYYAYIGNMTKEPVYTLAEFEKYEALGELIDFSLEGGDTFRETSAMLAYDSDIGVNVWELKDALQRYGVRKIPIDNFGMLDINQIIQ